MLRGIHFQSVMRSKHGPLGVGQSSNMGHPTAGSVEWNAIGLMSTLNVTGKMVAARAALEALYERMARELRGTPRQHIPKMRLATLAHEWRYRQLRQDLRESRQFEPLTCVCDLDRRLA